MKHLLVLVGITACFLTPLSAQNTPGNEREGSTVVRSKAKPVAKSTAPAKTDARCIYYITSVSTSGSHIPVVIRRYQGHDTQMFATSHGAAYTSADIGLTGSLNVQGALRELDPAISSVNR